MIYVSTIDTCKFPLLISLFEFFSDSKSLIEKTKEKLKNGMYFSRSQNSKTRRAKCWQTIHEIIDEDTNNRVEHLYLCTVCDEIIYNGSKDGNTMAFIRHVCFEKNEDGTNRKRIVISKDAKEKLTSAAAKFVSKDLRKYNAVEGEGLMDLCTAAMQFGQRHPKATANDLKDAWPSRYLVTSAIGKVASDVKKDIRSVMEKAKLQNGLAATTGRLLDRQLSSPFVHVYNHPRNIN